MQWIQIEQYEKQCNRYKSQINGWKDQYNLLQHQHGFKTQELEKQWIGKQMKLDQSINEYIQNEIKYKTFNKHQQWSMGILEGTLFWEINIIWNSK